MGGPEVAISDVPRVGDGGYVLIWLGSVLLFGAIVGAASRLLGLTSPAVIGLAALAVASGLGALVCSERWEWPKRKRRQAATRGDASLSPTGWVEAEVATAEGTPGALASPPPPPPSIEDVLERVKRQLADVEEAREADRLLIAKLEELGAEQKAEVDRIKSHLERKDDEQKALQERIREQQQEIAEMKPPRHRRLAVRWLTVTTVLSGAAATIVGIA